jgi:hypothetical protein
MNPYLSLHKVVPALMVGALAFCAGHASAVSLRVGESHGQPHHRGAHRVAHNIGIGTTTGWEASARLVRGARLNDTFHPQLGSLSPISGVSAQSSLAALHVAVGEITGETPGSFSISRGGGGAPPGKGKFSGFEGYHGFSPSVDPIPEPATMALYGFGALIAAFGLRRKSD